MWGRDRDVAIARTIRALEEMIVEGVATTIPADLAILRHPDFAAVEHSTKWVEETLDLSGIAPPAPPAPSADDDAPPLVKRSTTVEVNGKRFDVEHVGARAGRRRGRGAAPAKKAEARPVGGAVRRRGRLRLDRGADAGHDRQGARRGRPGGRGRRRRSSCSRR